MRSPRRSPSSSGRPTAWSRSTSPGRASSTSPSTRPPRASWPAPWSRPGRAYGSSQVSAGHRFNLEFVSANPTGPLHLGHVRWAAVGDALARILQLTGAEVTREYYFNDAGVQIDRFASSLLAAARGKPTPEDGYGGAYIGEIAAAVVEADPTVLDLPDDQAAAVFRRDGMALMFAEIRKSLADFGVHFDVYFNEKDLHDKGELKAALARLREQGHVYEDDGATWLRTTDFGDDKDRVLVKQRRRAGPTSPPTAPTTSTSGSAASTRSSSCSAPTTTATSAATRRWSRPTATTRTSTSRSSSGSWSTCSRTASRCG